MWSLLLFTTISVLLVTLLWIHHSERGNRIFLFIVSIACIFAIASAWFQSSIIEDSGLYTSGFRLSALTAVMVWITTLIWHLKPTYARYPYPFTLSPLLLLLTFPWIASIPSLMVLFLLLLEGAILLILLLLWISLRKSLVQSTPYLLTILVGSLLLGADLFRPEFFTNWMRHLLMSGLVATAFFMYRALMISIPEMSREEAA